MAVFYINGRETEVTKNQKLLRYLRDRSARVRPIPILWRAAISSRSRA